MAVKRGWMPADDFTIISNRLLRDPRLGWKEKGLLAYVASHAAGYQLRTEQIIAEGTDGRDAVRAALRKLEETGYLHRIERRNEAGQVIGCDYEVVEAGAGMSGHGSDQAIQEETPAQPSAGFPGAGSPPPKKTTTKKTKVGNEVPTPSSSASASDSEAEEPPKINAGSLVADWIDYCGAQGIKLTPQAIARYGARIKELLAAGFDPKLIKHALARQLERGQASRPALLDTFVIEVQGKPVAPRTATAGFKSSAEKQAAQNARERGIAVLCDELEERAGGRLDYLASKKLRAEAERIYDSGMTTCQPSGYTNPNGAGIVDAEWTEDTPRREVTAG